jgi:hypothetical protein
LFGSFLVSYLLSETDLIDRHEFGGFQDFAPRFDP